MAELLAQSPGVFAIVAFLFALLVGSFLNVVIYRLPIMMYREWQEQCQELQESETPELPEQPFNLVVPAFRLSELRQTDICLAEYSDSQFPAAARPLRWLPAEDLRPLPIHRVSDCGAGGNRRLAHGLWVRGDYGYRAYFCLSRN